MCTFHWLAWLISQGRSFHQLFSRFRVNMYYFDNECFDSCQNTFPSNYNLPLTSSAWQATWFNLRYGFLITGFQNLQQKTLVARLFNHKPGYNMFFIYENLFNCYDIYWIRINYREWLMHFRYYTLFDKLKSCCQRTFTSKVQL